MQFLMNLGFLDWWLLTAGLAIVDAVWPRLRLSRPAIAAGLTGFAALLFPQTTWPWQVAGFVVVTLIVTGFMAWQGHKRSKLQSLPYEEASDMENFHTFEVVDIDGAKKPLKEYAGQAVLVVNVASECGLTPQYAGLEQLQREFGVRGFTVLGLPCNQFGAQEPGTEAEIKAFCSSKYQVSFPLTSKIEVNGRSAHPLYQWLKAATGGAEIQWNFEKFLIGPDGRVMKRYSPKTTPEDKHLRADIESALTQAK